MKNSMSCEHFHLKIHNNGAVEFKQKSKSVNVLFLVKVELSPPL